METEWQQADDYNQLICEGNELFPLSVAFPGAPEQCSLVFWRKNTKLLRWKINVNKTLSFGRSIKFSFQYNAAIC